MTKSPTALIAGFAIILLVIIGFLGVMEMRDTIAQPRGTSVDNGAMTSYGTTTTEFSIVEQGTEYSIKNGVVYYYSEPIADADPSSFQLLPFPNIKGDSGYAKDKYHIFYGDHTIVGADLLSFVVLPSFDDEDGPDAFAKDKNYAYFDGGRIIGADATTFISFPSLQSCGDVCRFEAEDKNSKYMQNNIVQSNGSI